MNNFEEIYYRSRIIHGDLFVCDEQLKSKRDLDGVWFLYLKSAFIALANLSDAVGGFRVLYSENPELSVLVKEIQGSLEFSKYIRNVFSGHINSSLLSKTYEWLPQIRKIPEIKSLSGTVSLNIYVLETAINTYVSLDGGHGIFDSETDFMYPPDKERFLHWFSDLIGKSINICDMIGGITHTKVEGLGTSVEVLDAFIQAGSTEFRRIRKGRV
ncbi:hypothetical protein JK205_11550 [Gluconobacter cerinus]|uniref:hypothetical protein n=1 Tax=Gluconobacter cerinus TaxID=38307 RepID=UPI001B8CC626|nr:hypothetical protein [Gluconobacter cerinus]MBS1019554.1 hypothetical protein [Gluconobacter cerinus]